MPPSTPAKEGVPAEDAVAETAPLVAEPAAATKTDDVRLDVDAAAAAAPCKDWETPIEPLVAKVRVPPRSCSIPSPRPRHATASARALSPPLPPQMPEA